MTNQHTLPLEFLLESICNDPANFPTSCNYFDRYSEILRQLRQQVYKKVDAGLAALSEESGLYTDHGEEHFDDVVLHAGLLLGIRRKSDVDVIKNDVVQHKWVLTPYEVYILLLSIRLHDVGNIYGRENHEKNINKVIQRFSIVHLHMDRIEKNMVSAIAGAHGGETPNGDKDTIGKLQQNEFNGHISDIDNKKIAAITRFADEICENRQRVASSFGLDIPEHNLVFHKYAQAIYGNSITNGTLSLRLQFHIGDLLKTYKVYNSKKELVDINLPSIVLSRLRKAELERRYCNRFIPHSSQIREIFVSIEVIEDEQDEESFKHETIDQITFTLKEEGYPQKDGLVFDNKTMDFMNYDRIRQICKGEAVK